MLLYAGMLSSLVSSGTCQQHELEVLEQVVMRCTCELGGQQSCHHTDHFPGLRMSSATVEMHLLMLKMLASGATQHRVVVAIGGQAAVPCDEVEVWGVLASGWMVDDSGHGSVKSNASWKGGGALWGLVL